MAQWVKAAIAYANTSQADLARQMTARTGTEFDRSMVNKMALGRRILSAEELLQIEEITGFPAPAALRQNAPSGAELTMVPLVDTLPPDRLAAPMSPIEDDVLRQIQFAGLGRGNFIALTVKGDAMDRCSPEGSIILIDRADRQLISGKPYVFSVRGETTFRLFRSPPPRLQPHSWSAVHEPRFLKGIEEAENYVIGRVKRTVLDL